MQKAIPVKVLKQCFLLLLFVIWPSVTPISTLNARPAADHPNIIYILADDLGYSELGCYGQKTILKPNIDRLATEGIKFTQHYSGQAVCAPARCSLLTGYHMGHAYIRNNSNPPQRMSAYKNDGIFPGQVAIPDSSITIPELLKKNHFATAAQGNTAPTAACSSPFAKSLLLKNSPSRTVAKM